MKKLLLLTAAILSFASMAYADTPFRNHRYDVFKGLPVNENSIVFYGNSITNMNEWRECFGSDPRIINRGNSGGMTQELLDNCESIIVGRPAKLFIAIGTNDLGTSGIDRPELVASNIGKIVDRFLLESPKTEVYVQSILPSTVGLRTLEKISSTNKLLEEMCGEKGVTFIDVYDAMMGITNYSISYDGLHVTAKGYKIWCDILAPYVGVDCSYPSSFTENNSSMSGSNGMRSTYWSVEEVTEDDILFIGDELIHGGEWCELLKSSNAKDRGIGWGYGGLSLDQWLTNMTAILSTNSSRKAAPKAIALYMGVVASNDASVTVATAQKEYQRIIDRIRRYAPYSKLVLMSLIPKSNNDNADRIEAFNEMISGLADSNDNTVYADIYTPLASSIESYITNNYLYAAGYAEVAKVLSPILGTSAVADDEFDALYNRITSRTQAGSIYESSLNIDFGSGIGQYDESKLPELVAARKKLIEVLASESATVAEIDAAAAALSQAMTNIDDALNQPEGGEEHVYTIVDYRSGRYVTEDSKVLVSTAAAQGASSQWKFIANPNGGFDIVNCNTGNKVNTTASYNTQLRLSDSEVSSGWEFKACDLAGYYIIVNGSLQFNTTTSALSYQVYNWGSGSNTSDTGCQYLIAEVEPVDPTDPSEPEVDDSEPVVTLLDIECDGTAFKVPDELAELILTHDGEQSVAIDITIRSNSGRSIIASACDSLDAAGENHHFSTFVHQSGGIGVVYIGVNNDLEGWYTRGSSVTTGRFHLIFTMSATSGYDYYVEGTGLGNIYGTGDYGIPTFGTVKGANALYLGGTAHGSTANKHNLTDATINSARFYNRRLSSDECGSLVWDNLTGITAINADSKLSPKGVYDISGRKFDSSDNLLPGLYIIDGQKTLVK